MLPLDYINKNVVSNKPTFVTKKWSVKVMVVKK